MLRTRKLRSLSRRPVPSRHLPLSPGAEPAQPKTTLTSRRSREIRKALPTPFPLARWWLIFLEELAV